MNVARMSLFLSGLFFGGAIDHAILGSLGRGITPYGQAGVTGNAFGDVYNNVNQVYMAGLMAAPMVVIELVVMQGMYYNAKLNGMIICASVVLGVVLFVFIRQQTGVSDVQFLRSMIPHHSSAILMCREASIQDLRL